MDLCETVRGTRFKRGPCSCSDEIVRPLGIGKNR